MVTPISAFSDCSEVSESTLFLKYKEGKALPNAPFKLVELLPMSTSIDEDSSSTENKHRVRGPYRKYTCQEKQEAVECVHFVSHRSKTAKMSISFLNVTASPAGTCCAGRSSAAREKKGEGGPLTRRWNGSCISKSNKGN